VTRRLEEIFGFPQAESTNEEISIYDAKQAIEDSQTTLAEINSTIDKIELALPAVKGLESSDSEMDELASRAVKEFDNLMDLGMNVDSRYASEIFGVASQMLGHAITAKNAKINKKLKIIELQMKKLKLDQDTGSDANLPTAQGHVLDRNELLTRLLNRDSTDTPKS
jgi:predicted outer membrane protein